MDVDAFQAITAAGPRRNVDARRCRLADVPERCARSVREQSVFAAREYGGAPTCFGGDRNVANGIDAAMYAMQGSAANPDPEHLRGHAELEKLRQGDDPVLAHGEPGHPTIHGPLVSGRVRAPQGR
jgi:hypothetical protein